MKGLGGEVVGSTRYPIETFDQSSFLLQAQASKAQVIGLAGSGTVLVNAIKSAQEFRIPKGGQTMRLFARSETARVLCSRKARPRGIRALQ